MLRTYLPGGLELEEKPRNTLAQGPSLHSSNSRLLYGPKGQPLAKAWQGTAACQEEITPATSSILALPPHNSCSPVARARDPSPLTLSFLLTKLLCWKCPPSPVKTDSSTSPHTLNTSETPSNMLRLWKSKQYCFLPSTIT